MKKITRGFKAVAAAMLMCAAVTSLYLESAAHAQEPALRIAVEARKFDFGPKEIKVKKGQRVTLVLTSKDFAHGFSVPDFNVRADAIPGKTIEVTFVADKAGKFTFVCDNFCGEDHDKMMGFLIVTEG